MHPNTERVLAAAAARGLAVDIVRFPQGTRTAQDAAAAIGCDVAAIVKTLVFDSDAGPLVVFASGANRVDVDKVGSALGVTGVRRADPDVARAATGYPIGGTAPFGWPGPLPALLDEDLVALPRVWAAGGTADTVFAITPSHLLAASGARTAAVAQ